nr:hypothetical protein [Actinospica acidiphila]
MYEPIRSKSVHSTMAGPDDFPHRSREEELDIQLAGHLAALLAVTDELRVTAPSADLDTAAERLTQEITRLREDVRRPVRPRPRAAASRTRRPCTGRRTRSPDEPWSSPRPARTRRRRSWPPSGWTRTRRR